MPGKKTLFLISLFMLQFSMIFSQTNTIILKDGLAIKTFNYFAKNMFTPDPIEAMIIKGIWSAPKTGDSILIANSFSKWKKISADEKGWFQGTETNGGYIHFIYESQIDEVVLLAGFGHNLVYANGELHTGNRYGTKDEYESWEPRFDYSQIPVEIKKGKNEFLFHCSVGKLKVKLIKSGKGIFLNANDVTLPDLIAGQKTESYGSVVVINATDKLLKDAVIITGEESKIVNTGNLTESRIPVGIIQPMSVRKISFLIKGSPPSKSGLTELTVKIIDSKSNNVLADSKINLRIVSPSDNHKRTFISNIDGSVQYYSVNPAREDDGKPKALFLSVHGASVEALNQSGSYFPKTWGHVVSPTNRRPYGFNWEDWGRLDAMEVYNISLKTLKIDPGKIYLTGHSMGGHGTWHLGATFPDKFAAIGPSAGWISFWSYRVRERNENPGEIEKMIMRATNSSDTYGLSENYKQQGVYIIHGADDDNVPATESRNMVENLKKFHKDFIYHEQPGAGHWWDVSDEKGSDCVDWPPLFDFFSRHSLPQNEMVREIDFITANPGISARNHWVVIHSQREQLKMSRITVRFDPGMNRFIGKSENIAQLKFDAAIIDKTKPIIIELDNQKLNAAAKQIFLDGIWLGKNNGKWNILDKESISGKDKHPARYGTLKSAINNNVVFIYGTKGNSEENAWAFQKARYDAEQFWYQGNGSIQIITDLQFEKESYSNNNFVLYGNAETNSAWNKLLSNSPVQVTRGKVKIGIREFSGKDLACLFVRPLKNSDRYSVGVVSGSGIVGMKLTDRRLYLQPGYPFPDLMLFNSEFTSKGIEGVLSAGYFGLNWSVDKGEFVWK